MADVKAPVTRKQFQAARTVTNEVLGERVGWQVPPYKSIPLYVTSAGDDAIDLAHVAGLHLDEWQQFVLRESLGQRANGKYAAKEVALLVTRQQGKTVIAEARELAGLFLFNERLITHTAHLFDTAKESFLRMRGLIEDTPVLAERVHKFRTGNDDVGIEMKSGQRLKYKARSKGSGRGLSGDLVIFDEAYALDQDNLAALIPALSAMPNPQIWYMSSTGQDDSEVLRSVCDRGRAGTSPSLAYFEWAAEEDCNPYDKDQWYRANPALGIRLDEEFVSIEQGSMGDVEFKRERLGLWASNAIDSLIPAPLWKSLEYTDAQIASDVPGEAGLIGQMSFAVDADPDGRHASIYVAGLNADRLHHVELAQVGQGINWVPAALKELEETWQPKSIAVDTSGPAGGLVPQLNELGVKYSALDTNDVKRACQQFLTFCEDNRLRHRRNTDDPGLTNAVAMGVKRSIGPNGAWAWARKDIQADITPLVAATYALYAYTALEAEIKRGGRMW